MQEKLDRISTRDSSGERARERKKQVQLHMHSVQDRDLQGDFCLHSPFAPEEMA